MLNGKSNNLLFVIIFTLFLSTSFISLSVTSATSLEREYWPTEEWQLSTPKKQKMDSSKLNEMVDYIDYNSLEVDSITIVRNGYIIFEEHFRGSFPEYKHFVWSVTKSFTSALIGIALFEGYIEDVNLKVVDIFPEITINNYTLGKENITIANLLTMTAGFDWTDDINWPQMVGAENQVAYILNLPMIFEPWTYFNYDTGGTHLLSAIISKASGNSTLEFAQEYLFNPIGIRNYSWDVDNQGYYYGGHGIYMVPRDMARFGYLYLNNGTWDGESIIHTDWVRNTTEAVIDFGGGEGYGGLWWVSYGKGYYAARGRHGQMIYVVPEHDIVAVVTSNFSPTDGAYYPDYLFEEYILSAIEGPIGEISIAFFVPLIIGVTVLVSFFKRRTIKNREY